MKRIYLDNAATSWPKPSSVYQAVDRYQRELGVAAGRGSYRDTEEVERTLTRTRLSIAKLIGAGHPEQIIFTHNCTDSLNLAIHGLLDDGDHVITSMAEHNSILRPLEYLAAHRNVSVTQVAVNAKGVVDVEGISQAIQSDTRLIAVTHASNVTGTVQPIETIGRIAREHDCVFLVDAAQTLGHLPFQVCENHVDLLAGPGHKGLLGPLGTGILYIADGIEQKLRPIRQGGTGTQSELAKQPEQLPSKYESGNLNVLGLYGLDAGVSYLLEKHLVDHAGIIDLSKRLCDGLAETAGVRVYSAANEIGIVSFGVEGYDPSEIATLLDLSAGIQVRAGLHCAPLMHQSLGTFSGGGTVRASFGHFSSVEEVDTLVGAVETLAVNPIK